jgi:hypothetical protein
MGDVWSAEIIWLLEGLYSLQRIAVWAGETVCGLAELSHFGGGEGSTRSRKGTAIFQPRPRVWGLGWLM